MAQVDPARSLARWLVVKPLWSILGRRNLARFARFLQNEVRLDGQNAIETNGEILVQRAAVERARKGGPAVVLDVGANVGRWSRHLVRTTQEAGVVPQVHAFEPCRGTAGTLRRNLEEWGIAEFVRVNEFALSNLPGDAVLQTYGDGQGRNSLLKIHGEAAPMEERVRAKTLDGYAETAGLTHVDLLKVDTEGHDLEVLRGGSDLIKGHKIAIIQFEYNHRWIAGRHFLLDAFDFLGAHGYRIGKVTPEGVEFYRQWHRELETFREANLVACVPERVESFRLIPWWNNER